MTTLPVKGIDVSQYNGDISNVLKSCNFAFARASIGGGYDRAYPNHLADMHRAGVVRGAYHYATFGPGPTRQAKVFLTHAGDAEILAIDAESTVLKYPKTIKAIIINVRKLDPHKRKILLYSSQGTWPGNMGQDANWVARWGDKPPTITWLFWQNRGAPLDRDIFNGTLAQLYHFAGR